MQHSREYYEQETLKAMEREEWGEAHVYATLALAADPEPEKQVVEPDRLTYREAQMRDALHSLLATRPLDYHHPAWTQAVARAQEVYEEIQHITH